MTNREAKEISFGGAVVRVGVRDERLARRIGRSVSEAVRAARDELDPGTADPPVLRWRTSARLAALESGALVGALGVVRVTAANLRRLSSFVDRAKAAGALGIQLVWDGETPARAVAEKHVFAELERAREAPREAPVVLSSSPTPGPNLVWMARYRAALRAEVRA